MPLCKLSHIHFLYIFKLKEQILKSLKIYYLSSEIEPFSNTYSLSKFSKQFSSLLNNFKECDIRLIQPKYGYISERKYILREVIRLKDLKIVFQNKEHMTNLKSAFIPNTRVQLYFMEHEEYFKKISELLYKSRNGRWYNNNHEKFSFFVKTVLESLNQLFWFPDVIICNDWQMSYLPYLFKQKYKNIDKFKNTKIVTMIHSIDDVNKYHFPNNLFKDEGLDLISRSKTQNMLDYSFKYSDMIYIFDDGEVLKKIKNKSKTLLQKSNHKVVNMKDYEDTSERINLYNQIKNELEQLVK